MLVYTFAALTLPETKAVQDAPCPASKQRNASEDSWFAQKIWATVGQNECLKCHKADGDAADTRFILRDPTTTARSELDRVLSHNREAFAAMARMSHEGRPLLVVKATGGLDHGGKQVIAPDSGNAKSLEEFALRLTSPPSFPISPEPSLSEPERPFFEGVAMCSDSQLLQRATLSLAGRLPTRDELEKVSTGGLDAVSSILDQVLREEAFYERLREGFNDIFLTQGIDGNPDQTVLSYEHFEKTRGWYQHHDLTHITDEKEREKAGYKLANEYRAALLDEPMRLIEHIVRNDRPFTEIITADYIMVSPYSARGYGVFEELKDQFRNLDDPFEYVPVKLKALIGRNKSEDQESSTGFYPHAGVLSTFQYLSRYPTTETNRNRLRARMYYLHFLGVDVLELAARGSDAAAVTAKFEIPTMQASECVVCHRTLDPVASLFQDYWRFDTNFSIYGRRKDGWFTDMFQAGFEGVDLPAEERWRALQWLGEKTVQDPRFARTMAGHAWFLLTGRRPVSMPKDADDPLFSARYRAWQAQQCTLETIAEQFASDGFNFRVLIKGWVLSDLYRSSVVSVPDVSDERLAELDDVGVVRMLSPEQLERKIFAVFGTRWGRLTEQTAMLYGGIDSKEVTERAADPSGAMGAIQRTMSNDVACRNVSLDFSRSPDRRLLFPKIEPDVLPGKSNEHDQKIRDTIVHLHRHILAREDTAESLDVERTFQLFASVVKAAEEQGRIDPQENWHCRQGLEGPVPDPNYTVRAWRAVVTYLLRQPEFLYE